MSGFDLVLLLIGIGLVIISFLLSEKLSEGQNTIVYHQPDPEELKESIDALKRELNEYLEKAKESTIDSVNDSLCHLSNEKIMNINEYSDMVLDRIDKNHSEVVFLYGMLNDKEKEMKQMFLKNDQYEMKNECKKNQGKAEGLSGSQAANMENAILHMQEEESREQFEARQEKIIELFKSGKTVSEIAKQLDIGRGEVQLVVNIFTGGSQ